MFALDEDSERQLRLMPEDIQDDVMENFSPNEHIKDVNALFKSFAATRSCKRVARGVPKSPRPKSQKDRIDEFIEKFGLDAHCEEQLRDLPSELQEDVMSSFNPKPDVDNMAALFRKFASTRTLRTREADNRPWKRLRE